ncbi:hypothetical protein GAY28_29660 [Azospirillum brasilense]|nr:hypothetical protein [Azospirillum brasilense]
MDTTRELVRMANQIASYFQSYPQDEAVTETAGHIRAFWEPRMRQRRRGDAGPRAGRRRPQPVPGGAVRHDRRRLPRRPGPAGGGVRRRLPAHPLPGSGVFARGGGTAGRPAHRDPADGRGRHRSGGGPAAGAGAQGRAHPGQRLADRRRGLPRHGPWRPLPGDLQQPDHLGRHLGDPALPAPGLLPGHPRRPAAGGAARRQPARPVAADRRRARRGLREGPATLCPHRAIMPVWVSLRSRIVLDRYDFRCLMLAQRTDASGRRPNR